ncbi:gamma-glutamylcyclotransferase [Amycolatopsis rubida]|uniref:Gamma-glutamyl cyclotransferase, AIG2-like n=1 Tax=Amycolatopsis rubida TaxID=112413 RepID=A0A1I5ICQ3_9PSEU|nr:MULTISPECIES: gamma-glutamylcyclotransferase [Amycolatopsis]MYW96807.1 gamma-glutamylcyclotransferase [Amycolatopsis rubida]NEC61792.1 gamma-glutamylcyclotransferase [Amycolatopsis rubida]OAP25722.1 allophanate hydrolase [Amycolatopsis sp. M39]SFO58234.1 Gamma-glutamyl cyclotransferase, AIG2-like [Amycolatopsis rubida]
MPLMFLNGGAMRGEPLHHLLDGAPLVAETTTAAKYRFYSVGGQCPALVPVAHGGAAISGEVYDLTLDQLRDRVLPSEPPELELGVIELADGSSAFAMLLRRPQTSHVQLRDITEIGDWRAFKATA